MQLTLTLKVYFLSITGGCQYHLAAVGLRYQMDRFVLESDILFESVVEIEGLRQSGDLKQCYERATSLA